MIYFLFLISQRSDIDFSGFFNECINQKINPLIVCVILPHLARVIRDNFVTKHIC